MVRLNAAAFHYDYRDKQFYTYQPLPALNAVSSVIVNIPKSKVNGFDADVLVTPSHRLSLRAAVTYLDTEIQRLAPGKVPYSGLTRLPFDPTGKQFNYAPEWSSTFDAEYRVPISESTEAIFGAGGQWYSKSYSDLGEEKALANPSYVTIDLRAGLQDVDGRWRASVWARNVTNKDYWTSIFRAGDVLSRFAGRPRVFGASVGYSF
jgi:outer membrane receptor protein involved in Fe transport